jgi:signal transduction histidine kinase
LRCAYPIAGFCDETHAEPFLRICCEHSTVIPGENYTTLRTEQDRLRNIAQLQQKAEALETEKALLQALRRTKEELEKEVAERREAQRRLYDSELSLRKLSGHLLRTQDEERRRLGRELPRDVELVAFRVLQESLTNVHRHSGSPTAHISVRLERDSLLLEIKDSGKGLPPNVLEASREAPGSMGVGLRGMSERVRQLGGTLTLPSGSGTTVSASIPCEFESSGS